MTLFTVKFLDRDNHTPEQFMYMMTDLLSPKFEICKIDEYVDGKFVGEILELIPLKPKKK